MNIAQNEATIPINATPLSPSKRCSKSSMVILNTIKAIAKTISTEVKIFMCFYLGAVKVVKNKFRERGL
jgi:hypothetical protein